MILISVMLVCDFRKGEVSARFLGRDFIKCDVCVRF